MVRKIKKTIGTFPETIVVLSSEIAFDAEGIAEITDDAVFEVLCQVPGYSTLDDVKSSKEASEDEEEPKKAPAKKRPSPRTKSE